MYVIVFRTPISKVNHIKLIFLYKLLRDILAVLDFLPIIPLNSTWEVLFWVLSWVLAPLY